MWLGSFGFDVVGGEWVSSVGQRYIGRCLCLALVRYSARLSLAGMYPSCPLAGMISKWLNLGAPPLLWGTVSLLIETVIDLIGE